MKPTTQTNPSTYFIGVKTNSAPAHMQRKPKRRSAVVSLASVDLTSTEGGLLTRTALHTVRNSEFLKHAETHWRRELWQPTLYSKDDAKTVVSVTC